MGAAETNTKKKNAKGKIITRLTASWACVYAAPTTNGVMSGLELARTFPHLSPLKPETKSTEHIASLGTQVAKLHYTQ
jgi:hypothetical protein